MNSGSQAPAKQRYFFAQPYLRCCLPCPMGDVFTPVFVIFLVGTGAWASLCCWGGGWMLPAWVGGHRRGQGGMLGVVKVSINPPGAGRSMAKAPSPLCHQGNGVPQPSQGRPTLEELAAFLKWRPIFRLPGSSGCAARCQRVPAPSWKLYLHNLLLTALRLPCCSDGLHGLTLKLLLPSPLPPPPFSAVGADWTVNIFCTTDLSKPLMI